MSSIEKVDFLLKRSKEFLEEGKRFMKEGRYHFAAFFLEQALQLFVKAKIIAEGGTPPRTHDIARLLSMLSRISSDERKAQIEMLLKTYPVEIGAIQDAYIISRYVDREYRKEEVERMCHVVEEVMKSVR